MNRRPQPNTRSSSAIVQEGLSNILKHAKPKRVILDVKRSPGAVSVSLVDDGIGFDTARLDASGRPQATSSAGLVNMVQRAKLLGGNLEIKSTPRDGHPAHAHYSLGELARLKRTKELIINS